MQTVASRLCKRAGAGAWLTEQEDSSARVHAESRWSEIELVIRRRPSLP